MDFQPIVSQFESHNRIVVNNSSESLEKVLPEYQVSQPYLNQVQRYSLAKMAKNHQKTARAYGCLTSRVCNS